MLTSGVNAWRVLLAHFDLDMEVRPAWWVLGAGLAIAAVALLRQKPARQRESARRISAAAISAATQVQSGS
jgi:sulfoxide reductase heme-binding subunit YedZ